MHTRNPGVAEASDRALAADAARNGPKDPWEHLEPWDRQPGETASAFRYFTTYRDLGANRTLVATAAAVNRSISNMRRLSYTSRWAERATAYDNHLDRQHRAVMAEQRRVLAEEHLSVASQLLAKGVKRLQSLSLAKMNARDTALFIDTAIKIQRLALGDTTANVRLSSGPADAAVFTALSPQEQSARLGEVQREIERRRATVEAPTGEDLASYQGSYGDEDAGHHSRSDPEPPAAGR